MSKKQARKFFNIRRREGADAAREYRQGLLGQKPADETGGELPVHMYGDIDYGGIDPRSSQNLMEGQYKANQEFMAQQAAMNRIREAGQFGEARYEVDPETGEVSRVTELTPEAKDRIDRDLGIQKQLDRFRKEKTRQAGDRDWET